MNKASKQIVSAWSNAEGAKENKYISVDQTNLQKVAAGFAKDEFKIPNWRFDGVYPKHEWAFAAFQLFANCFNFAFNIFEKPDEKYMAFNPCDAEKPFAGAFAMNSKIYAHFWEKPIQYNDLYKHFSTPKKAENFFRDINLMPLSALRSDMAMDYATRLIDFQYNTQNLLEEATVWDQGEKRSVLRAFNNGKGLVEILVSHFPVAYGDDVQTFGLDRLAFNKRAQLVAVMIHGRALDSKGILPPVIDIDEVGPIADYELPKALRHLGILKYSEELAELVDNWKEIPKDSQMEIEIRMATVAACDMLLKGINFHRHEYKGIEPINICHLDYWLWKMGKDAKNLGPHLTRTSAY